MAKSKRGEGSKISDFVNITITVPYSLLSQFDEETQRRGYTRSEAVRQAMRRLLEIWTGRRL